MTDVNLAVSKEEINSGVQKANAINGTASEINETLASVADKQETLVSGTNIKTINNTSILGEGNIEIQGGSDVSVDNETITKDSEDVITTIGVQEGNSSKVVKDWIGTLAEYEAIAVKDPYTRYSILDDETGGGSYTLPIASTSTLGGVKVDGSSIVASEDGVISSEGADKDLSNLSADGKSLGAGFGMPSKNYTNLTLRATGSTYTMPANGYLFLTKKPSSSGQYIIFEQDKLYSGTGSSSQVASIQPSVVDTPATLFIPVLKGDVIRVYWSFGGETKAFKFIYAEGEI